jgi:hypothetical protein
MERTVRVHRHACAILIDARFVPESELDPVLTIPSLL